MSTTMKVYVGPYVKIPDKHALDVEKITWTADSLFLYKTEENFEKNVLFPHWDMPPDFARGRILSFDRFDGEVEITGINPDAEIEDFRTEYAEELGRVKAILGDAYSVRWGVVNYWF